LTKNIAVFGLGYVGLPLCIEAIKSGYKVFGVDVNLERIDRLKMGQSDIEGVNNDALLEFLESRKFEIVSEINSDQNIKIILICVPTPLDNRKKPDLSMLTSAVRNIGKVLTKGTLVIVESTIEPGTTRNIILPILEKESGLSRDQFELTFSPERIDPNNNVWQISNTPKLVAGLTTESAQSAAEFYSSFVSQIEVASSLEAAEAAKLLENSFRLINISFVNEFRVFCEKLGIDVQEVIRLAATKPYGFMPFYPSIGVGGHCIPIDPMYLANKATEIGAPSKMINLAYEINSEIPEYISSLAEKKIGRLVGKKIIVIGITYKPNISDMRETQVSNLISALEKKGSIVKWHDQFVQDWKGSKSVPLSSDYDLAIVATKHDYIDISKLGSIPILNTSGSI
jgi:UDP-N-acetyl-D-glucosamine dehydrogenase